MNKRVLMVSVKFSGFEDRAKKYFEEQGLDFADYKINGVMSRNELKKQVKGISGLIAGPEEITEEIMDAAGSLEVICAPGVGTDHIDISAASKRGIAVCNCAGTNKDAVAEMVVAYMILFASKVHKANSNMHEGRWKGGGPRFELKGKTLGIVGAGNIGKALADKALGLGMNVLLHDVNADDKYANKPGIRYTDMDELLRGSDFISLNCPLTEENENMISLGEIEKMKPSACLINAARGRLVDESALVYALRSGKIAGAALDTFREEPLTDNHFAGLDNVILTPHCAGGTAESKENAFFMAAGNIGAVLSGKEPENCLNINEIRKQEL